MGTASSLRVLARPGVAWVVLALCLLVTLFARQVALEQVNQRGRERFELHIQQVTNAILSRMQGCEQVLKGVAGLFAASEFVTRSEWQRFAESLELPKRYPGMTTVGFIAHVSSNELSSFIASNHLDFTVYATNARAADGSLFVVQRVASRLANPPSLGLNVASDVRMREPAELARDTGESALTPRIKWDIDGERPANEKPPTVLLLTPVYRKGTPDTVSARRASIDGWAFAAIVLKDFMDALDDRNPQTEFEIFDGMRRNAPSLLYDADDVLQSLEAETGSLWTKSLIPLPMGQRTWSLHFRTRPAFDAATDYTEPYLLTFGGICISFLLFGITRSLASTRQRALVLAHEMTEKFHIQERAVISSNNGIFITDSSTPHNPIIYANPALERITGYDADELIGRDPRFLMRDDFNQPDLLKLEQALAAGEECQVVLRSYRKNGSLFWNELSVSPVRDEHGIVNHFVGITEDITERKRADEILRATSALQRAILDSAGYAVISTSAEGLIRIFNAAAERMTGYKAAEVIGRPTSILIHDWTEVERRAKELSAELGRPVSPDFEVFVAKARLGRADEHEWTYVTKHGTRLPVLLSVTPVRDERGIILGFMGIASDITERKRAESQLTQARHAAEAASRTKGEFLANMSHEIRTPMNAVMGMIELGLATELTREQRGYLTAARNSAIDLLTIINDVLDFSKIEAGKLELHPEPFQLRDALGLGLKTFSLRAAEKGLELSLRVQPDVPDALEGDAPRLRQVLNNLVSNALKFTEKGEVEVDVTLAGTKTAHLIKTAGAAPLPLAPILRSSGAAKATPALMPTVTTVDGHCTLHFRVRDTGIGVALDKQKAIFEAFTQADASVTRRYGGTGLGLAIAARLCRLMGGEIWVESERGQGSTFHFTAAFSCPAEPAPAASVFVEALDGERVLVVDDNATNRRILCEMLANWRMVPQAAASADEALAVLHASSTEGKAPFRCLLLDASMPESDSFSLAREINRHPETAPKIIMMLSSTNRSEEISRCHAAGVENYLIKPVGQSELLDVLLRRTEAAGQQPTGGSGQIAVGGLTTVLRPAAVALRVLLAEDNSVNRELATTVLEKLGHTVRAVWNGQEALNSWSHGDFDLILMDVQMPILDGLETTARIRQQEEGTCRHIPIIGLTAHAMKGDRELGLSSGMDEYLTKPLQLEDLARAIEKLAADSPPRGAAARKTPETPPAAEKPGPTFDPDRLLKSFGGDKRALRRLVTLFVESTPPILENIRRAAQTRDAAALHREAHTLKGSLTLFDDPELRRPAAELERPARTGDVDQAVEAAARLDSVLVPFLESLRRWLDRGA